MYDKLQWNRFDGGVGTEGNGLGPPACGDAAVADPLGASAQCGPGRREDRGTGFPLRRLRLALVDLEEGEQAAIGQMIKDQAGNWRLDAYSSPGQALSGMRLRPPDVLLLDLGKPGLSVPGYTRTVQLAVRSWPTLIITDRSDTEAMLVSLMAGARGYLLRPVGAPQLVAAVVEVARGGASLCVEAQATLLDSVQRAASSPESQCLTQREREVAMCLVRNLSDKEISKALGIENRDGPCASGECLPEIRGA
jgi:DNA-binding NarL/FixJ family response regulator